MNAQLLALVGRYNACVVSGHAKRRASIIAEIYGYWGSLERVNCTIDEDGFIVQIR